MSATLLRFSLSSHTSSLHALHHVSPPLHFQYNRRRRPSLPLLPRSLISTRISAKAVELKSPGSSQQLQEEEKDANSTVLLDVSGMMCGACVSRVKSILAADERVDSVVVNMLTETAAIKLKEGLAVEDFSTVAEELSDRVSNSGFDARRRVSGMGVEAKIRKWKETVKKKEELLAKSRNRVAFAWTLVALCCGAHGSHLLHSIGIHVGHGEIFFSSLAAQHSWP